MCNLAIAIFLLQALHRRAALALAANGENVAHADAAVLPYSLKAATGKENSERYTLFAVNPANNQADEQIDKPNNINVQQHRGGTEDAFGRISLHYKNQLTQVNPPIDEFGYYNPHSAVTHTGPVEGNPFAVGAVTPPLPLALLLILNLGIFLYLFVGIMSTISAATGGFNLRLPHHMYLRRDGPNIGYN